MIFCCFLISGRGGGGVIRRRSGAVVGIAREAWGGPLFKNIIVF